MLAIGGLAARFKGAAKVADAVRLPEGHIGHGVPRTQPLVAVGGGVEAVQVRAHQRAVLAAPQMEGAAGEHVCRVARVGNLAVAAHVVDRHRGAVHAGRRESIVIQLIALPARELGRQLPAVGKAVLGIGRVPAVRPAGAVPVWRDVGAARNVQQLARGPRRQARHARPQAVALVGGSDGKGGLRRGVPVQRGVAHLLAGMRAFDGPALVGERQHGAAAQRAGGVQWPRHVHAGLVVAPGARAHAAFQAEGILGALARQVHRAAKVAARAAREQAGRAAHDFHAVVNGQVQLLLAGEIAARHAVVRHVHAVAARIELALVHVVADHRHAGGHVQRLRHRGGVLVAHALAGDDGNRLRHFARAQPLFAAHGGFADVAGRFGAVGHAHFFQRLNLLGVLRLLASHGCLRRCQRGKGQRQRQGRQARRNSMNVHDGIEGRTCRSLL